MFRTFTLPVTTTLTNLWSLIVTAGFMNNIGEELQSSVKNFAIIPDRVCQLDIRPADTAVGNITYIDQQQSPGTAQQLTNMSKRSSRNSICLKDYLLASSVSAGTEAISVEIEGI